MDGATITYAYTPNTQTATQTQPAPLTGNRFKRTTVDGFGRTVRVETGHDGITVSTVDTQYGPCACSPLGKMTAVSQPYAPGAIPAWTTYTYDSSGRTLTVTSPDGASVTRYTYQGNQTTVTDPAGKSKTFTSDAMGNLISVSEPDPVLGTDTTTYTYNAANQLLTVTMPRSNGTQTRSFQWTGSDMTSVTNPENGTVTYTYDGAHRVLSRTDAKGQKTQYTYDGYGRKTMVQHFNSSGVEQASQRVTYTYGDNSWAQAFSQNAWGRLSSVQFSNETPGAPEQFTYMYSYSQPGRVTTQQVQVKGLNLDAFYGWDNEGKMTTMVSPGGGAGGDMPMQYGYSYDPMGRLNGMTEISCPSQTVTPTATQPGCTSAHGPTVATAAYGPAGEMTGLTYDGFSETRTYNSLLQLTRMTATGSGQTVMDMTYTFSGTENNGRITQSTDNVSGETVVYTYDTLNRLASAAATSAAWGEAYTYDGFGNLTAKTPTGTAPSMTAAYDAATNHQVGTTYDANGNTGFNGTYPYDVENHLLQPLTSGTGLQWTYDPSGKRVFAKTPGNGTTATTCEIYFYGITGQKLVTFQCGYNDGTGGNGAFWYQVKSRNVYFGGKLMRSAGVTVVTDRLGSVRANSNGERMSYFPYGEERTSTADGREKFGTYFRDSAANGGLDYADRRYYANASGRFLTADPYTASGGSAAPGSWNRYAYVQGDPVNYFDSRGQFRCNPDFCNEQPSGGFDTGLPQAGPVRGLGSGIGEEPVKQKLGDGGGDGGDGPDPGPGGILAKPLECDYTGAQTPPGRPVYGTSGTGITAGGFGDPITLSYQASGGTGTYSFSVLQTILSVGQVTYSSGMVSTGEITWWPDALNPTELTQDGSKASFYDSPGVWWSFPGLGSTVSASVTKVFNTYMTVSSGTQTYLCPTVSWSATVNWPLGGTPTGQAVVGYVTPGGPLK